MPSLPRFSLFLLSVWLIILPAHAQLAPVSINQLRCEMRENPLGVDQDHPRLSWELKSSLRNQNQSAYRIQVASSQHLLMQGKPDLWDTGKQQGAQTNNIPYMGTKLRVGQACYWRVMVWDGMNHAAPWSSPAYWKTGLQPSDWQAQWVQGNKDLPTHDSLLYTDLPAPIFRKEFAASRPVKQAMLHVTGLGYYEAYLNGAKVGDCVLDPGWTDYSKRIYYQSFDVTKLIAQRNSLGMMLGNGWYNPLPLRMWGHLNLREHLVTGQPCFIAQLNIEYADGSTQLVLSDTTWRVSDGPIVRNSVYLGEHYDARLEQQGWNSAGFNDQGWSQCHLASPPAGRLQSQPQSAIRIMERIEPVAVRKLASGHYLVDMGVNFAGVVSLTAKGNRGTVIDLKYGELLYPDGSLNPMTSVAGQVKGAGAGGPGAPEVAFQEDQFTLAGTKSVECFQPRFTFHGFRYVEISNYPGELSESDVQGIRLHAAVEQVGHFTCSDTLLNALQEITRNTFLSNIFSVQSDCPHREKFGYGGDIVATSDAFMANFDMAGFYAKTVQDFADAARYDGGITETAPFVGIADAGLGGQSGPIGWGTAMPQLLDQLYTYYGNLDLLRQHYPLAQRWVQFIGSTTSDGIIKVGLSDHESIAPKPVELTSTAFYYYNVQLLEKFARLLGDTLGVHHYAQLQNQIKGAFVQHFHHPGTGWFGNKTQTAQAFALYFGLVPDETAPMAVDCLLQAIEKDGGHVSTGIFGTRYMLQVLSRYGHGQKALELVTQQGFPGWAYMLANGATSLWEHWEYSDNTFSHNHPMFGSVSEWLYKNVAGIQPDTNAKGFDKMVIKPGMFSTLSWVDASYHSVNGVVSSKWRREDGCFELEVTIPVNTTATIYLPSHEYDEIRVGGMKLDDCKDVHWQGMNNGYAVLKVGSGHFKFLSR